jgi:oxygen-independent coproporphyrinogen-3 oxidase
VQALNDADLKALGRTHSAGEAKQAIDIARHRFDRVSFDLIYARQSQSLSAWQTELREALALDPSHLSLYQLTIEDGTPFAYRHQRGLLPGLPDEDLGADMYLATQEICVGAGLPAYEVSNHAKPGAESRHNLIYWRGGDYAGIGPGAHGRLTIGELRHATETALAPNEWLSLALEGRGEARRVSLTAAQVAQESLLMGLRLQEGVELDDRLRAALDAKGFQPCLDLGYVDDADGRLRVTDLGRPILNAILREILRAE